MAHFVAFFISFQKIIPSKIPPGGGTGVIGGSRTIYTIRNEEQLPVPVAFCDLKLHQKRHICNFRIYHPISFKFAIQVHNCKR